jgi:predicted peptidase
MIQKSLLFILSITLSVGFSQQRTMGLEVMNENEIDLKYLFFLPKDYYSDINTRWPLILFLHGMGERGANLELVKIHGIPKIIKTQTDFPFITVSPQCPIEYVWRDDDMQQAVEDILLKIVKNYRVDKTRIYVTGLSMGGYGTWSLAARRPDLFAAAVPICGGGDPATVNVLKNLPIWVFHGGLDEVVLPKESEKMVRALEKAGGKVRYTLYPEAYHDSWTETYDNTALYDWLLSNRKVEN